MTMSEPEQSGPYTRAAQLYWAAGWEGCLPLPVRGKASPPTGYTGADAGWPSFPDVIAWTQGNEGNGNIGLRLPHHVIGIDVDQYGTKRGAEELDALIAAKGLSPLPPTWVSGSRLATGSGISLYHIDAGLAWPGEVCPGVEIIQYRHRYAVVWPSVHPEGGMYRWQMPDGLTALFEVPNVDELPPLPPDWVTHLTGGAHAVDYARIECDTEDWVDLHGAGQPCRQMNAAMRRYSEELCDGRVSRHDVAKRASMRMTRMISEGHPGGHNAISVVETFFRDAVAGDRGRDGWAEWHRMLDGAVSIAAAEPMAGGDPCTYSDLVANPRFVGLSRAVEAPPGKTTEFSPDSESPAPGGAEGQPSTEVSSGQEPISHTTWFPLDITELLSGVNTAMAPVHLRRADGAALLYAGKVNGLIGESESGKSFMALLACVQALGDGERVSYIDFEDSGSSVIGRLRALGVADEVLREQFAYLGPSEALDAVASADLASHLEGFAPRLIVLDGFNAAMGLLGLKINENDDATAFAQRLLAPLAARGASVVYVDHVPKNREITTKGGIGAQAKRAMTDGSILRVEVVTAFGRGQSGEVKLVIDKDRPGHVRGLSATSIAGHVIITAGANGELSLVINVPSDSEVADKATRTENTHHTARQRISDYLLLMPDKCDSKNHVEKNAGSNSGAHREAVAWMLGNGYLSIHTKGVSHQLTLLRRYSTLEMTLLDGGKGQSSSTSSNLVQTSSMDERESSSVRPRPVPSPVGGGRGSTEDGVVDDLHLDQDDMDEVELPPMPEIKHAGGPDIAELITACVKAGGKPLWQGRQLINTVNGEVLAER